jgi:hypothetical protein
MRALPILLMLPLFMWADEAADRADIQKVVAALNNASARPTDVWARGVDGAAERAKLISGAPMSEVFGGKISAASIQFPARRIALVYATQTQFGSLILSRSISLVIMMKKVRGGWRITGISLQQ